MTGAKLNVPGLPAQSSVFPRIGVGAPGSAGLTVTLSVCGAEAPQILFAVTEMRPLFVPLVTVLIVVLPLAPVNPLGKDQEYDVAPLTGVTVYCWDVPAHTSVLPVMADGATSAVPLVTVTDKDIAKLETPQTFTP